MTPRQMRQLREDVDRHIKSWEQDPARRFNVARQEDFSALLQALRERNWNVDSELAVCAGLAAAAHVGMHRWPPPSDLIAALLTAFGRPENQDPRGMEHHLLRAPEFVVAFLLGWLRCPHPVGCREAHPLGRFRLDLNSHSWLGLARGAHEILRRFVVEHVDRCLQFLAQGNRRGGVPGFPTEDYREWTADVLQTFLAHVQRCDCWRNIAPRTPFDRLTGNARAKAVSCQGNHNIDSWRPARLTERTHQVETLWYFAERAAKGFVGPFLHEGFPAGILHSSLLRGGHRLVRANVVQRQCALCGWTVCMSCEHGGYRPAEESLRTRNWLILMTADREPDGGFVRDRIIKCSDEHLYFHRRGWCRYRGCEQGPAPGARPQTCYFMP